MKLPITLITTALLILIIALYKRWQPGDGLEECSPWPLDLWRLEMDIDAENGREARADMPERWRP